MRERILETHKQLFDVGMSTIKGFRAHMSMKEGAEPIFHKARPVPYALRDRVQKEIERLVTEGILTKVESSDWASPIVVVPKTDGSLHICGDYKVSINRCLEQKSYPFPNVEDLFATLAGWYPFHETGFGTCISATGVG